ncbi:7291_t:CDS:1 [Racocetra fulgida]|uniref:7291_t:CDS:1 n=1 Tax=Racocetra fulgida TaxID=60492 RepID=A0A9N9H4V5_9GLOM|nr:7291_t:CDS:1 [Racocetra fulgida]
MLVESIELLADSSVFKYYSIEAISKLESHLRTLVSLIEVICKNEIRLRHDLREKIYAQLGKFADIHFRSTEVNEEGFNKVFRSKFEEFNPRSNDGNIHKDGKRNYNIDFLLLHLRDTLHCMRDDENKFLEIWNRIKTLLCMILGIAPGLVKTGISHGADLPIENGVELLFKCLHEAFNWKYPIPSWYYEWRTLLELHFNIQNFLQECSLSLKYGEGLLLECLWHCVSKSWSNPISQTEYLINQKHFINNLLGKEPLAFPHSLWFGALDIAQDLITKTQKDSTLGICYYLALESLQKASSSFIRFKAIEVLIKLSKRNTLFYNIIENDFKDYKYSLDSVEGLKLHHMIEAIRIKISQDEKLVDSNKNNICNLKEKEKAITTYGLTLPHTIIPSDNLISDIVTTELSCPVTYQIPNNFQILPCEHLISPEALQQIINKTSQPTCPHCRKIIDLNSVINLPQSAIYQGIRNHLPEDNKNIAQDNNTNISDESSDEEEINISKLKSQQKFRISDSTIKKFFKAPKFFNLSLRKANAAYKLGELETAINALQKFLKNIPQAIHYDVIGPKYI